MLDFKPVKPSHESLMVTARITLQDTQGMRRSVWLFQSPIAIDVPNVALGFFIPDMRDSLPNTFKCLVINPSLKDEFFTREPVIASLVTYDNRSLNPVGDSETVTAQYPQKSFGALV